MTTHSMRPLETNGGKAAAAAIQALAKPINRSLIFLGCRHFDPVPRSNGKTLGFMNQPWAKRNMRKTGQESPLMAFPDPRPE